MTTTYTYDADNELTSETSPLATINYSYDADGNRISGNNVIGPDNQLLSDGTWNYTYDADGNLIQKVGVASGPDHGITWTYTYDNRNQMTSAVEVQGSTTLADVTYAYDVFGNRIEEDYVGQHAADPGHAVRLRRPEHLGRPGRQQQPGDAAAVPQHRRLGDGPDHGQRDRGLVPDRSPGLGAA